MVLSHRKAVRSSISLPMVFLLMISTLVATDHHVVSVSLDVPTEGENVVVVDGAIKVHISVEGIVPDDAMSVKTMLVCFRFDGMIAGCKDVDSLGRYPEGGIGRIRTWVMLPPGSFGHPVVGVHTLSAALVHRHAAAGWVGDAATETGREGGPMPAITTAENNFLVTGSVGHGDGRPDYPAGGEDGTHETQTNDELASHWRDMEQLRRPEWPPTMHCPEATPNEGFRPFTEYNVTQEKGRPIVIASFVRWFDAQGFDTLDAESCSVSCVFVNIPSASPAPGCLAMADVLLSTALGTPPVGAVKPPYQVWGYYSLESGATYTEMDSPSYMSMFDMEITTRTSSDVQITFAPRDAEVIRRKAPVNKIPAALYLQGNCVEERDSFVKSLMGFGLQVESFGKCLNNRQFPENVSTLELVSRYRYMLCLENSIYPSFVTERLFNAWIGGAIPIYRGAPDVGDYAPTPGSYILADDFKDAEELADYLLYLDRNQTARLAYLAFKDPKVPLSPGYLRASGRSFYAPGGETGSADPFPSVEDIGNALSLKDPKCNKFNFETVAVSDDDGRSVLSPRSHCFDRHRFRARDHHRYNLMASCRICKAARLAIDSLQCPANRPSVSLKYVAGQAGFKLFHFQSPEDGHVAVRVTDVMSGDTFDNIINEPMREGGWIFMPIHGIPRGNYELRVSLVSLGRRQVAEKSIVFHVLGDPAPPKT